MKCTCLIDPCCFLFLVMLIISEQGKRQIKTGKNKIFFLTVNFFLHFQGYVMLRWVRLGMVWLG